MWPPPVSSASPVISLRVHSCIYGTGFRHTEERSQLATRNRDVKISTASFIFAFCKIYTFTLRLFLSYYFSFIIMATCVPFQTQLSSIMEVLVKAAVAEISKLVDDKCAFLHLEISRKQSENEMLKRKLMVMENKTAQLQRGYGETLSGFVWEMNHWLKSMHCACSCRSIISSSLWKNSKKTSKNWRCGNAGHLTQITAHKKLNLMEFFY